MYLYMHIYVYMFVNTSSFIIMEPTAVLSLDPAIATWLDGASSNGLRLTSTETPQISP